MARTRHDDPPDIVVRRSYLQLYTAAMATVLAVLALANSLSNSSRISDAEDVQEATCELLDHHFTQYRIRGEFDIVAARVISEVLSNAVMNVPPSPTRRLYRREIRRIVRIGDRLELLPLPDCGQLTA